MPLGVAGDPGGSRTDRPPRTVRWGSFPTTADVGIWARAHSAHGLLEGLGCALFAQMTDLRRVRPRETRCIEASGRDPSALVVAYLTALLALEQDDGFLARRFRVKTEGRPIHRASAEVVGEPFEPGRHRPKIEVKAVTLHRIRFDTRGGEARVILDI